MIHDAAYGAGGRFAACARTSRMFFTRFPRRPLRCAGRAASLRVATTRPLLSPTAIPSLAAILRDGERA
jgi:hypothetical protein